jgi:type I pullulanase
MVVDLESTNPEGWDEDTYKTVDNATDATIWEVQVKDFSYSESSGVSKENRGKFLAFTEDGTVVNGVSGNSPTCISYLKKLGVSYVQINPFYDFGSVDETGSDDQYNWGYDPVNYNVPEGSFSSDPYNGNTRINECKQMIQALHNAGIGVIMDVVYNHTYTGEDSYFNKTVPYYYYRMNEDGSFSDGSGCGNDTASEHKMFRKFMVDSVTYWAKEYHIDGFRFDLMGLHDVETMNQIRASLDIINPKLIMYGEAWDMSTAVDGDVALANQNNMSLLDNRIGAFDDTLRDALKGNTFDASAKGFLAEGKSTGSLKTGIGGQSSFGWANAPTQTVSYSSCHDNYTLYDKLVSSVYGDDAQYRKRYSDLVEMTKLNCSAIFASQGMTFFLAGEEFCRSKDGDENSYKSSADENMIDWENVDKYSDVVDYYKGMIQIRNKFSAFRDPTSKTAESINYMEDTPDGVVAFTVDGLKNDTFKKVAVVLNGNPNDTSTVEIQGSDLPEKWVIVANEETAGLRSLGTVDDGKVELSPSSAMILVDKESFDKNCKSNTGGVVVDYVDSDGNKVMTENVTGKIGEDYDITPSNQVLMNYKILEKKDTTGTFSQGNSHATITVEAYQGSFSSVTFRFIDSSTEKEIAPSVVLTNQVGQQYFTDSIPSVKGYVLDTDSLPENGAGLFTVGDRVVTYKYTKEKTDKCQALAIYMDSDGNVMDVSLLEGKKGDSYNAKEKEYENLTLVNSPENAKGKYSETQQIVIYNYQLDDNTTKMVVVTILLIVAGVLAAGGITLKALSSVKKKRQQGILIK